MPLRINVPNLYLITGIKDSGKTTLGKALSAYLGCELISVDDIYYDWLSTNVPNKLAAAKQDIRRQFIVMPADVRLKWHRHLAYALIARAQHAERDMVAESILLDQLTPEIRAIIERKVTTVIATTLRNHDVKCEAKTLKAQDANYSGVVKQLPYLMQRYRGSRIMIHDVPYQAFEDLREYQGSSDSAGKLLALHLPEDMTGLRVLDVGCNTGYFCIRCRQRGAVVTGVDVKRKCLVTASRIANAIYGYNDIVYEQSDFLLEPQPQVYDYVLAVTVLPSFGTDMQKFFVAAYNCLKPGGMLVIETVLEPKEPYTAKADPKTGRKRLYPTDLAVRLLAHQQNFEPIIRDHSVRRNRKVYHFRKPVVV